MVPLMDAAVAYARAGWRVIPIWWVTEGRCGCGKPDCAAPGKHPLITTGKGLNAASCDVAQVTEWWTRWPEANIAVACGDGYVAIDCDLRDECDGFLELNAFLAGRGVELPATLMQETGSGGRHVFLALADGQDGIKNAARWLDGVDVRSKGGYVIVPPSRHVSGREYRWLTNGVGMAVMSPELFALVRLARSAGPLGPTGARTLGPTGLGGSGPGEAAAYDYQDAVRSGPKLGSRDDFFNRRAFELRKQGWPEDRAVAEFQRLWSLTEQNEHDPFTWADAIMKLKRVYEDDSIVPDEAPPDWNPGMLGPSPAVLDLNWRPRLITSPDPDAVRRAAQLGQDDEANALRWTIWLKDTVRFVKTTGSWYDWDGRRWNRSTEADIIALGRYVVNMIYAEAELLPDESSGEGSKDTPRGSRIKFAVASHSSRAIHALMGLARGDTSLWVEPEAFDPDPYLLNVLNGTLDLRTGELRPHAREDMITTLVPRAWLPDAPRLAWESFVGRTFQDAAADGETLRLIQKALGYSALIGHNIEQRIFFVIGPPNTGKSKLLEIVGEVLGPDLVHKSKTDLISRKQRGHHDSEGYSIVGKRFVMISETSSVFNLDESSVKELTGDLRVTTRRLYDRSEVNPRVTWTVWLATNDEPNVLEWDEAIARRVVMIPAGPPIPPWEEVKDVSQRLIEAEPEGVLAWLVAGARAWYHDWQESVGGGGTGLALTLSVALRTERYRHAQDHVAQFVAEVLELDGSARVAKRDVLDAFKRWRGPGEGTNRNKLYAHVLRLEGVSELRGRTFVGVKLRQDGWAALLDGRREEL